MLKERREFLRAAGTLSIEVSRQDKKTIWFLSAGGESQSYSSLSELLECPKTYK
jgi:hypothetical protein